MRDRRSSNVGAAVRRSFHQYPTSTMDAHDSNALSWTATCASVSRVTPVDPGRSSCEAFSSNGGGGEGGPADVRVSQLAAVSLSWSSLDRGIRPCVMVDAARHRKHDEVARPQTHFPLLLELLNPVHPLRQVPPKLPFRVTEEMDAPVTRSTSWGEDGRIGGSMRGGSEREKKPNVG